MAGKIRNYTFYNDNLSDYQLKEISKFLAKVEKFAKFALPKMGEEIKLYCEVANVVGQGIVLDLTIYGYNQLYDDQFEFLRVNDRNSMLQQAKGIFKAFLGPCTTIDASAYWRSKMEIAGRSKLIGPYVQAEYDEDAMGLGVDNIQESRKRRVSGRSIISKSGRRVYL